MAREKFPRTFNDSDFGMTTDVTLVAGKFIEIGSATVPAQQEIAFGVGEIANGVDSREFTTLKIVNTSDTQQTGVFRLAITNANETDIRIIKEDRSENLDNGTVPLAETRIRAREDSKLKLYFKADSNGTMDANGTSRVILVPVTVYQ